MAVHGQGLHVTGVYAAALDVHEFQVPATARRCTSITGRDFHCEWVVRLADAPPVCPCASAASSARRVPSIHSSPRSATKVESGAPQKRERRMATRSQPATTALSPIYAPYIMIKPVEKRSAGKQRT